MTRGFCSGVVLRAFFGLRFDKWSGVVESAGAVGKVSRLRQGFGAQGVESGDRKRRRKQRIMDWRFYYGIADCGFAARRPKEPARRGQAEPAPNMKTATGLLGERSFRTGSPSGRAQSFRPSNLDLSAQASDFSPVGTNFDVFRPISQSQGFGFSPVTRIAGNNFSAGGACTQCCGSAFAEAPGYGGQGVDKVGIRRLATGKDG
jgi:hypothetical protein